MTKSQQKNFYIQRFTFSMSRLVIYFRNACKASGKEKDILEAMIF